MLHLTETFLIQEVQISWGSGLIFWHRVARFNLYICRINWKQDVMQYFQQYERITFDGRQTYFWKNSIARIYGDVIFVLRWVLRNINNIDFPMKINCNSNTSKWNMSKRKKITCRIKRNENDSWRWKNIPNDTLFQK